MSEPINLAENIRRVLLVRARIKALTDEFEAKIKPFEDYDEQMTAFLLQHLNQTNQRSAQTEHGGIVKKSKVTYRVTDKDSFRRHVVGSAAWQLIEWRAASSECETFTAEHEGQSPPGLHRDARLVLTVTPPTKPRKRKSNGSGHVEAPAEPAGELAEVTLQGNDDSANDSANNNEGEQYGE